MIYEEDLTQEQNAFIDALVETKTTIGRDLQELGYKDDLVKQVDDLFFRLYCMRLSERDEVAGVMKEYIDRWVSR